MTTIHKTIGPWLRRWGFLPPREAELVSAAQLQRFAKMAAVSALMAVVLDLVIYRVLRDVPEISRPALEAFAVLNISGLSLAALIAYLLQIRPERPHPSAQVWICPLFGFTTVVWIQLTGCVSSYFIMAAAMEIILFRAAWGWKAAFATATTIQLSQMGAFALEELGVLRSTSLLVAPSFGLESIPAYRAVALASITMCYGFAFIAANAVVNRLRAQRRELERVRRDLAGLAEGTRQGRLSGTEIDRWFVDELLGRGGMGEVYAAHNERGEQVAIKVLYPHLIDDDRALARFEREQQAGQKLEGRYFPRLIAVATSEDGTPYIVMERLRGEDLGAFFRRRGRLTIPEVRSLTLALGAALDGLHALGIVHRDLTPANIFLVASNDASWPDLRVLDLGVCKLRDVESALTETANVVGTPGFMAPEQIVGPATSVGPASDVFALAAILYRALTGESAFAAGSVVQAIENVCRRDPIWPSQRCQDLPVSVDAVFRNALHKQPAQRTKSAGELARVLRQVLAER